jgi:toxin ParE1/3/4
MHVRWTPAAADDFENIVRHIREENLQAARQVADEIYKSLQRLLTFPSMGRPGEKSGTRELVIPPYVVVYRIAPEFVELLRIWHSAQNWTAN